MLVDRDPSGDLPGRAGEVDVTVQRLNSICTYLDWLILFWKQGCMGKGLGVFPGGKVKTSNNTLF